MSSVRDIMRQKSLQEQELCAGSTRSTAQQMRQTRKGIPDPEVQTPVGRRRFSATYKARIVREADACTEPGSLGSLLRREGLYSSHLTKWRKQYKSGAEAALADDKRGRKPTKDPLEEECERLRKELERTQRRLKQAETIIEFQKNLSEMLGISPTSISGEGER